MTESSPVTLLTPYRYPHGKVGSVGQLLPSTAARVLSLDGARALPPHQPGELLLRGPQVTHHVTENFSYINTFIKNKILFIQLRQQNCDEAKCR